jgi:uncharacterized protein (DUF3820 family)
MTLELLRHLMQVSGRTLEQEMQLANKPAILNTMPFGMHKGMSMMDVPLAYFEWLLTKTDISPDLKKSVEHFMKIRKLC